MHIKHGWIWSYHGAHAPCWDVCNAGNENMFPYRNPQSCYLCLVKWRCCHCVQWRHKSIKILKRPFMGGGGGGGLFLLIHWWPHKGPVMCHCVRLSDRLGAILCQIVSQKKIILFYSYTLKWGKMVTPGPQLFSIALNTSIQIRIHTPKRTAPQC